MSGKIKSKDLKYDSSLPPFLQRLHAHNAGRGDTDRHERPVARPTRAKDPNDDDGPTIVDETGETVSKEEYEQLTKPTADDGDGEVKRRVSGADVGGAITGEVDETTAPTVSGALPKKDAVTDGLASKKRKAAKVVGDDEEPDDSADTAKKDHGNVKAGEKKPASKPKKKAKPIKLAFDDDG